MEMEKIIVDFDFILPEFLLRHCLICLIGQAATALDQEEYYSGHKKFHCLKYQSVLCPDGILASLKEAYPGRRHDAAIFRDSRLYQELEQKAIFSEEQFVLYGDQGYGIMELLITPYPGQPENLAPHQLAFNQSMKNLRVAVEWGFAKIIQQQSG